MSTMPTSRSDCCTAAGRLAAVIARIASRRSSRRITGRLSGSATSRCRRAEILVRHALHVHVMAGVREGRRSRRRHDPSAGRRARAGGRPGPRGRPGTVRVPPARESAVALRRVEKEEVRAQREIEGASANGRCREPGLDVAARRPAGRVVVQESLPSPPCGSRRARPPIVISVQTNSSAFLRVSVEHRSATSRRFARECRPRPSGRSGRRRRRVRPRAWLQR